MSGLMGVDDDDLQNGLVFDNDGQVLQADDDTQNSLHFEDGSNDIDKIDLLAKKIEKLLANVQKNDTQTTLLKNELAMFRSQNEGLKKQVERLEKEILKKENRIQEMLDKLDPLFGN